MMRKTACLARAAAAVVCCAAGAAHAQAEGPTHDPFVRPAASAQQPGRGGATAQGGTEAQWAPALRAVMLAGAASMADVDGAMVRIGEAIDGYRLVEVREEAAVFEKSGKRYVLKLGNAVEHGAAARSRP